MKLRQRVVAVAYLNLDPFSQHSTHYQMMLDHIRIRSLGKELGSKMA